MIHIETVLCPIDFTQVSRRELETAVALSAAVGSRIVLHHNVAATPIGLSRAWEWDEQHRGGEPNEAETERRMRELLASISRGVRAEARISAGSAVQALLSLVDSLPADLVVIGSHGWSTPDHASVSERVIDLCRCPVLSLPDAPSAAGLRFPTGADADPLEAIVATDFSVPASVAVDYAVALARALPLRLHLLHVAHGSGAAGRAAEKLAALRPADLGSRVETHVLAGDASEGILEFIRQRKPALLVMGQHARGMLRRFLTHDTATDMLHAAAIPVWFVPSAYRPSTRTHGA